MSATLQTARPARTSARAAARPAAPGSTVRLTRRGRLVVFLLALGVLLSAGLWLAQGSMADGDATPEPTRVVVVAPGETLWGLAQETAAATGEGDAASLVTEIQELNDLDAGVLRAGQELRVPLG